MNKSFADLVLIGLLSSTSRVPRAANHHVKGKLAHSATGIVSVRNAQDCCVAPADSSISGAYQLDEALSPPAGH
jgi:hypothetical protein